MHEDEEQSLQQVLINDEDQYSLWPAEKAIPLGWKSIFGPAEKEKCLAFISENWTDMRPKNLRDDMDEKI